MILVPLFRFEVPDRVCCKWCRNFKSAALGFSPQKTGRVWRPSMGAPLTYARGWRIFVRHPLNDPTPAGATDAGVGVRIGKRGGPMRPAPLPGNCRDGHKARPDGVVPPAGATDAGDASPNSFVCRQAWPTGSATKRVLSPDFTRIRTVRLPSVRALVIILRTSAGVETVLPATSRITSPVEKP
jgi:hypothetical protein